MENPTLHHTHHTHHAQCVPLPFGYPITQIRHSILDHYRAEVALLNGEGCYPIDIQEFLAKEKKENVTERQVTSWIDSQRLPPWGHLRCERAKTDIQSRLGKNITTVESLFESLRQSNSAHPPPFSIATLSYKLKKWGLDSHFGGQERPGCSFQVCGSTSFEEEEVERENHAEEYRRVLEIGGYIQCSTCPQTEKSKHRINTRAIPYVCDNCKPVKDFAHTLRLHRFSLERQATPKDTIAGGELGKGSDKSFDSPKCPSPKQSHTLSLTQCHGFANMDNPTHLPPKSATTKIPHSILKPDLDKHLEKEHQLNLDSSPTQSDSLVRGGDTGDTARKSLEEEYQVGGGSIGNTAKLSEDMNGKEDTSSGLGSELLHKVIADEHGQGLSVGSIRGKLQTQYKAIYGRRRIEEARDNLNLPPKGHRVFDNHEKKIRKMSKEGNLTAESVKKFAMPFYQRAFEYKMNEWGLIVEATGSGLSGRRKERGKISAGGGEDRMFRKDEKPSLDKDNFRGVGKRRLEEDDHGSTPKSKRSRIFDLISHD